MNSIKKIIRVLLIFSIILALIILYIKNNNIKDIFTLKAVRVVKQNIDSNLKDKIDKLENLKDKNAYDINKLAYLYQQLGEKYAKRGIWDAAIENYKKAISNGRDNAFLNYLLAVAYANKGNAIADEEYYKKSEYHYKKAIKMDSNLVDAKYGYAILLYYKLNKKDKAIELLKVVTKQNPKFYRARFALARMYYENDNLKDSRFVYQNLCTDLQNTQAKELLKKCMDNLTRVSMEMKSK